MTTEEKLITIAENELKVYEAGKKAELAEQWEKRRLSIGSVLSYAFAGRSWNDELLETIPFDIKPSGNAAAMFLISGINDLKGTLERAGVVLDLTGASNVNNMFQNSLVSYIPKLDFSNCTASSTVFSNCTSLISIEELIPSPTATTTNMFQRCDNLEHCIFGGIISKSLNMADCSKLDAESYNSIFLNLDSAVTGQTLTLTSEDTVRSVYDEKYGVGTYDAVVATKTNWSFAHV